MLKGTPFNFSKHGASGTEMSELVPHMGSIADDICLIRSMHTGFNGHGSIRYMNAGIAGVTGRPALGSWVTWRIRW